MENVKEENSTISLTAKTNLDTKYVKKESISPTKIPQNKK